MVSFIPNISALWSLLRNNSLIQNSFYLILSSGLTSALGLIFWIFAARFFTSNDVGIGSASISIMMFLSILSLFGLNFSVIRFLPKTEEKERMINTFLTLIIFSSIIFTILGIVAIINWVPDFDFLEENPAYIILFVCFTIIWSIKSIYASTFISARLSRFVLWQEVIFGILKIVFLPILIIWGGFGIFGAWGIGAAISILCSFFLLNKVISDYKPRIRLDIPTIRRSIRFSFWNNAATILGSTPKMLLPTIIVILVSPETAAYFYMAWTITGVLNTTSLQISNSLFAEGIHENEKIRKNIIHAIYLTNAIIIPAVLILLIFSEFILGLFGENYSSNSIPLLRLLALACIPHAMNLMYFSIQRIKGEMKIVTFCYALLATSMIGPSIPLLIGMGIEGVGIAWLASNLLVLGTILFLNRHTICPFVCQMIKWYPVRLR
ncbi:MAG: oligosaccharide flippase family protein [Methanofollis sp.]|nr:oligosaccharide flippase family protein [Methanofollis sp.]